MAPPKVNPQIKARGKDVHWYKADIGDVREPARQLLENYSGRSSDGVVPHIAQITSAAASRRIRKLVSDGAPRENILGAELRPEFVDLGYDLFRDRDTLKSKFLIGDVFDQTADSAFGELDGKIDIIYAASFFHLFNWEDQVGMAERVARLLKPVLGSLLFGRQRGNINSGEYEHRRNERGTMFRHNEKSWKEMWKQVGKAMGSSWDVKVWLDEDEDFGHYRKNKGNGLDNKLDSGIDA